MGANDRKPIILGWKFLYQINVDMQQIYYMNKFLFKENIVLLPSWEGCYGEAITGCVTMKDRKNENIMVFIL